jgi:hypothetical protein
MVECRILPRTGARVTHGTVCRKSGCHMVRVGRLLEIFKVTCHAVSRQAHEHIILMTFVTCGARMTARQRERCNVVECRAFPSHRTGMANRTSRAESGRRVVRLRRLLEILLVTRHAVGG